MTGPFVSVVVSLPADVWADLDWWAENLEADRSRVARNLAGRGERFPHWPDPGEGDSCDLMLRPGQAKIGAETFRRQVSAGLFSALAKGVVHPATSLLVRICAHARYDVEPGKESGLRINVCKDCKIRWVPGRMPANPASYMTPEMLEELEQEYPDRYAEWVTKPAEANRKRRARIEAEIAAARNGKKPS